MYSYIKTIKFVSKVTAILLAFSSSSIKAQPLTNFVDLNQSRQFFENGQKQFEREINNFSQVKEIPKISLLENYDKPENKLDRKLIKNENQKIKSISNLAIDRYYIYSVIRL